ncbi:MAG: TolC family protein [Verrucomicrobiota bacterium]
MTLKIVLSVVLLSAVAAFGQQAQETTAVATTNNLLSLNEVVSEVLSNNPSLKSARANWEAMKQRIPQAKAWEDLRFGVDVERSKKISPFSYTDQEWMILQELPVTGKNRLRGKAASAEAAGAFLDVRRKELDLIVRARTAYFRLFNADKQLELNRKNQALWKQFAEIARAKFEVGSQTQADVLMAETELGKIAETIFDDLRNISDAQSQLNVLMNRPAQSPLPTPTQVNPPELNSALEELQQISLANRPDITIFQTKIDAAKARLDLAKKAWFPDPEVRIEARHFDNSNKVFDEYDTGVFIRFPWFNRGKYKAAIEEAKKMQESSEHDLASAQNETLGMVREQLKKVETFHHHSELFGSKLIPLARETLNSKRLNYETDKANFLDLLTAQRTLQEVESMYWNHLTDYQIAVAELEALVGGKINFQNPTIEKTQEKK